MLMVKLYTIRVRTVNSWRIHDDAPHSVNKCNETLAILTERLFMDWNIYRWLKSKYFVFSFIFETTIINKENVNKLKESKTTKKNISIGCSDGYRINEVLNH